jgi:hypothetical protein
MKTCTKCNETKDILCFYPKKTACKLCTYLLYFRKYQTKKIVARGGKLRKGLPKFDKTAYAAAYHQKRKHNPEFKLRRAIRRRLAKALKGAMTDKRAIANLGCTLVELRQHLESQFLTGMTWENYGEWHIDHIRPLASFDLNNSDELKLAGNFKNLQPLWAKDNQAKGDKW